MHANYKLNGTIELHFDTIEDMIILTKVLGNSTHSPKPIVFEPMGVASDCATFVTGIPVRDHDGMTEEQFNTVVTHMRNRELLMAVKMVKDYTGKGLKESKEYVDALRPKLNLD